MTGIFNIVSLEMVIITKKRKKAWKEAFVPASNTSVSAVQSMGIGFCCCGCVFCLQLLILNTLISLVVVTVLVDWYSNFRKCL